MDATLNPATFTLGPRFVVHHHHKVAHHHQHRTPHDAHDHYEPSHREPGLISQKDMLAIRRAGHERPKDELHKYDVGTITKEELHALKVSKNPKDHHLAATIERAKTAYGAMLKDGARIVATNPEGNGGYPVLTILPKGFDPSKPTRVQTHYHGFNATVADPVGHSAGLTARLESIRKLDSAIGNDRQTVFVLPEAGNAPAHGGEYATDWSNVRSQARTTDEALNAAGVRNPVRFTVSAHSGGGSALAYSVAHSRNGEGLKADNLELLDCLYGSQAAINEWSSTPNGQAVHQVSYFHGTNHSGRDADFAHEFPGKYRRVEVKSQSRDDIPKMENVHGQWVPSYSGDAHNRTVGQFMGSSD